MDDIFATLQFGEHHAVIVPLVGWEESGGVLRLELGPYRPAMATLIGMLRGDISTGVGCDICDDASEDDATPSTVVVTAGGPPPSRWRRAAKSTTLLVFPVAAAGHQYEVGLESVVLSFSRGER